MAVAWWMIAGLLVFLPSTAVLAAASSDTDWVIEETAPYVQESRNRRIQQIDAMLQDAKNRLADHNNGKRHLENEERISLERKVELYTRKVELIPSPGNEAAEVKRILLRENARDEWRQQKLEQYKKEKESKMTNGSGATDGTKNSTTLNKGQNRTNTAKSNDQKKKTDGNETQLSSQENSTSSDENSTKTADKNKERSKKAAAAS